MPGKKYEDFTEGEILVQKGKNPPYETASYIPITCPHCMVTFTEIKESDMKTTKASKCLQHLRLCKTFKTKGGEVPVAQKRKHDDSTIVELETRIEKMENKMASICAENDSLKNENDWLKTENTELETALANARAAVESLREQLLSAQKSVDIHREMGFTIMKIDNGLC
jgi:predicted RNase H-like nuclease (RuvC/YqgF family)